MPTVVAFSAGGVFEGARLRAAIVTWTCVAIAALVLPDALAFGRRARIAVIALVGLAAWTTLSILWAPLRDAALGDAERVWLYAGYALLAAIAIRGPLTRAV